VHFYVLRMKNSSYVWVRTKENGGGRRTRKLKRKVMWVVTTGCMKSGVRMRKNN
jgi:hypothetical protein